MADLYLAQSGVSAFAPRHPADLALAIEQLNAASTFLAGAFHSATLTIDLSAQEADRAFRLLFGPNRTNELHRRRAIAKARGKNWRNVR